MHTAPSERLLLLVLAVKRRAYSAFHPACLWHAHECCTPSLRARGTVCTRVLSSQMACWRCRRRGAARRRGADAWARASQHATTSTTLQQSACVSDQIPSLHEAQAPQHAITSTPLQRSRSAAGEAPHAVAVPTHFYKVILSERRDRGGAPSFAVAAFVMPNRPIEPATPLASFVVPLHLLESVTGLEFFPGVLTAKRRGGVDAAAAGARPPLSRQHSLKPTNAITKGQYTLHRGSPSRQRSPLGGALLDSALLSGEPFSTALSSRA